MGQGGLSGVSRGGGEPLLLLSTISKRASWPPDVRTGLNCTEVPHGATVGLLADHMRGYRVGQD
jgi:hypothetical protein